MGISIEETNSNPWQQAAQSMMSAGIGSLSGNVMDPPQNLNIDPEASKWNYNKAQINMNEPGARWSLGESHRMDQERGQQNWFQDATPLSHDTWLVNSFNRGQPIMNTGIPANNQRYKAMNAGLFDDPTADGGWIDRLSRWWYGDDDPENDFQENPPYDPNNPNHFMIPEENPPYDPNNPNHFMVPEGMDPELFEPGIETLQAGMNDSLQSLQYDIDQLDPDSPNYDDMLELLNSDMDMKYPWAQQALNLQDVIDLYDSLGLPLNTDRFMRRANKAGVQMTNRGGIIGLI